MQVEPVPHAARPFFPRKTTPLITDLTSVPPQDIAAGQPHRPHPRRAINFSTRARIRLGFGSGANTTYATVTSIKIDASFTGVACAPPMIRHQTRSKYMRARNAGCAVWRVYKRADRAVMRVLGSRSLSRLRLSDTALGCGRLLRQVLLTGP